MKTTFQILLVLAGLNAINVQPLASDCTFDGDCRQYGSQWITSCGSATNWVDAVDLDNDGSADFLHANVDRSQTCRLADDGNAPRKVQLDTAEALFPQPGVEMYALVGYSPTPFHVPYGDTIEPEGSPPFVTETHSVNYWAWNPQWVPRIVPHSGLGIYQHYTSEMPCGQFPSCDETTQEGWLRAQNPGIFGFRISKPDGWHLGWLKLEELATPITRPDGKKSSVRLVDYAVHPDPDTEIRAGEKARPALKAEITGGSTLLSWSTNWPGWTLSWSPTLHPVAWAPVEGVATNTNRVTLATTNASGFFRLQETP
jgi:hypothetical protein